MNAEDRRNALDQITGAIIRAAQQVQNTLGAGFLEKVCENALAIELRATGLRVEQQAQIEVHYRGIRVGDYNADLLVEGEVLVELKAVKSIEDIHRAQCMNYLKATGLRVCLLINFGNPNLEVKRLVSGF